MKKSSLLKYRSKRDFSSTPEPDEVTRPTDDLQPGQRARFVIQKHAARRLHYDLRLEIGGVLRSWAVPKEPSTDPKIKRLAVEVEDHPLAYRKFEGVIPEGHYGAGQVEIWDEGNFRLDGSEGAKSQLKAGKLEFTLQGKRLQSSFVLVKTAKESKQPQWLLIATGNAGVATSPRRMKSMPEGGVEKRQIVPMQPEVVDKLPTGRDWSLEVKWDGVRAICFVDQGQVTMQSKSGAAYRHQFPELLQLPKQVDAASAVLDGEIVVLAEDGVPRFELIQPRLGRKPKSKTAASDRLVLCLFDLLWKDGVDYTSETLEVRRKALRECVQATAWVQVPDPLEGRPQDILNAIQEKGYEGVVAKRRDSIYVEGRTKLWVKVKIQEHGTFVVAGWLEGKRKEFSALVLAEKVGTKLSWCGNVGSGFRSSDLRSIASQLAKLRKNEQLKGNWPSGMIAVKPKLQCEVRFAERTSAGKLRAPVFSKLKIGQAIKEAEQPPLLGENGGSARRTKIGKTFLSFTNVEKVYFPSDAYTKKDVINYYHRIAPVLLPYLQDRPLALRRFPDGIQGKSFFQKHPNEQTPEWVQTASVSERKSSEATEVYLCNDLASLLYYVNLGCIDFHAWTSRIGNIDQPDYYLVDLDANGSAFGKVVEAALSLRELLQELSIRSYVKTSGGDGIHVLLEASSGKAHQYAREVVDELARLAERRYPKVFTTVRPLASRPKGRVYFDNAQVGRGKTIAAPYSLRPYPGLPVSTPVEWDELDQVQSPSQFNANTIFERLQLVGDPLSKLKATWEKQKIR